MTWNFMFFVNSLLLGVGLAMDAFSVSLANGLNEPNMSKRKMFAVAGVFAAFQAIMPMLGWVFVHTIVQYFTVFERMIPWIALVLLTFIGGKMIFEYIKEKDEKKTGENKDNQKDNFKRLGFGALIIQGIATSIDALSVGFTIAEYNFLMALTCALIIELITFVLCAVGVFLGKKFGTRFGALATLIGGIILIAIGLEIFITGII